jgi:aspartyl-tRNA(Asn)/glutamyl-tRNA(Gln) amidotransferase subunit A
MSPIGLGSDVAISLRGPAANTGIVSLKATHGRIPMTGLWPRVPRRFWHVGPMARTVRDIALAYSLPRRTGRRGWLFNKPAQAGHRHGNDP